MEVIPLNGVKTCTKCKQTKTIDEFNKIRILAGCYQKLTFVDGYHDLCKICKTQRRENYSLKHKYGMRRTDFDTMMKDQDKCCFLCKKDLSILPRQKQHVDHSHSTGKVRGILCISCNHGLGKFQDNPELLRKAATYIETRS